MTSLVSRQHEDTRVDEVEGSTCEELRAVVGEGSGVGPVYYRGDGRWHRLFLDAGLLFWQEGDEPDADDDLLGGEHYADWSKELGIVGAKLKSVVMADGELAMSFDNGAAVRLYSTPRSDVTELRELRAAS